MRTFKMLFPSVHIFFFFLDLARLNFRQEIPLFLLLFLLHYGWIYDAC